jgi:hypothetical protein
MNRARKGKRNPLPIGGWRLREDVKEGIRVAEAKPRRRSNQGSADADRLGMWDENVCLSERFYHPLFRHAGRPRNFPGRIKFRGGVEGH